MVAKTIVKFGLVTVASCLMLGAAGCSLLDNVDLDLPFLVNPYPEKAYPLDCAAARRWCTQYP